MGKKHARRSNATLKVKLMQLAHAVGLPLPAYQSESAAGLDLTAAIPDQTPVRIKPRGVALVPTGLVLELPAGSEGQVRPRSGLALKHGVTVLNSPGTIDSDYRGEVAVILINLGTAAFVVRRGERIAQLIIAPVVQARLKVKAKLSKSARGAGGFGSTGRKEKPAEAVRARKKIAMASKAGPKRPAPGPRVPKRKKPTQK